MFSLIKNRILFSDAIPYRKILFPEVSSRLILLFRTRPAIFNISIIKLRPDINDLELTGAGAKKIV